MRLTQQSIGLAIRAARDAARMTLTDLARSSGISVSALSRIENGIRSLSFSESVSVADALGVDLNAVLVLAETFEHAGAREKREAMTQLQQDLKDIQRLAILAAVETTVHTPRAKVTSRV